MSTNKKSSDKTIKNINIKSADNLETTQDKTKEHRYKDVLNLFSKEVIIASLIVLIIVITGVLVITSRNREVGETNDTKVVQSDNGVQIDFETLEIADEQNERARGLMYRENICDSCGMLFVFLQEETMSFWMKDTLVSLDMVFINSNNKVVKIHKNTETNNTTNRYSSQEPAKYVIETKAGFTDKINLKEGDTVDIDYLKKQSVNFVWISVN